MIWRLRVKATGIGDEPRSLSFDGSVRELRMSVLAIYGRAV
jgi:hypothetical protein